MGTHLNRTVTSSEDEQLQESAEGSDESDEEIKIEETKDKTRNGPPKWLQKDHRKHPDW